MAIEWATVGVSAGVSAGVGAVAWVVTNFVGRPVTGIQATKLKAIEAVEQNTYVPVAHTFEGEERVRQAKAALRASAATLRGYARATNWVVHLFCRASGYELERAAIALLALAMMAGDPRYGDAMRRNHVNLFYWSIASDRHLTSEERAEIKSLWENRSEEASAE